MANQIPDNTNKMFVVIAIIAIIGLVAVSVFRPSTRQEQRDSDVLTSTGTYQLEVAPDQAVLRIEVVTNASTPKDASEQNRILVASVMNALKNQGLAASDIETSNIYLNKVTQWDYKEQKNINNGYQQITTLKITVADLTKVGTVLDAAVGAGATGIQDISFELKPTTQQQYKQQALTEATKVAAQKASTLASAAQVQLGKVKTVNEDSYNYAPYYYNAKQVVADEAPQTQISPQKVTISVSVTISYGIR